MDPPNAHDHTHDYRRASRSALSAALILLFGAFAAEVIGGLLAGSLALLADAAHLLTDIAAVLLALLAQWFASRPAGPKRSFGFRRLEIFAALINGVTLWIVAAYVLFEAIARVRNPLPVAALPMVAVATFGLIVRTIATLVLSRARGGRRRPGRAHQGAFEDDRRGIPRAARDAAGGGMLLARLLAVDLRRRGWRDRALVVVL